MKTVFKSYLHRPPELPWVLDQPTRWTRRELEWRSESRAEPVYIAPLVFGRDKPDLCHVFGYRHALSQTTLEGYSDPAHFIEYVVFVPRDNIIRRLVQDESSPAFTVARDDVAVEDASEVDVQGLADGQAPVWRSRDDAWWPTRAGTPMRFAEEIDIPKTRATEDYLTYDKRVRLFYDLPSAGPQFAILHSSVKAQTADEHYASEELRGLWR